MSVHPTSLFRDLIAVDRDSRFSLVAARSAQGRSIGEVRLPTLLRVGFVPPFFDRDSSPQGTPSTHRMDLLGSSAKSLKSPSSLVPSTASRMRWCCSNKLSLARSTGGLAFVPDRRSGPDDNNKKRRVSAPRAPTYRRNRSTTKVFVWSSGRALATSASRTSRFRSTWLRSRSARPGRDGNPHILASIVKKQDGVLDGFKSRLVFGQEGGDIGITKYLNHPTDRRKKLLVIDARNEPTEITRAIWRAMRDYYGGTIEQLRALS